MAEGLDGAAQAFHTEINPQARPRDDGGRFASSARPETMFEERKVEGDPLTGDTRDGGEDQRLLDHERRVADGWAEEGDDGRRKPVPDRARARNAAGDDGHERANAEPERIGEQEGGDQDAQGPDGKPKAQGDEGDAEGPSEQDADSPWQITLDGKPVEKLEVTVDGQPHEVTLSEALKGYVDGETYNRRVAQVGEAVKVIESEYQRATQFRDHYIQSLQVQEEEYAALIPREPNWDQLFAQDPRAAHELQKNFQGVYGVLNGMRQRRAQEMQAREQENARKIAEYANNGWEQFKRHTRIADQATLNNEVSAMRKVALEHYGFGEHEVATTYDPRMLAVLHDASKYRRMMADKPRPVMPDRGRTLAPGSARPIGSAARRSIDDAQRKLAKTGKLDDATAVFERLIR
jgi:hypothetical protein